MVAQRETIRPVTPGELGKDGGIDVRVSNDVRSDGAPQVVGAEQKGLDGALGKAMKEGEEEESDGDPVQSYPQVLRGWRLSTRGEENLAAGHTHDGLEGEPCLMVPKHVGEKGECK